jgi:hypothetical protein
MKGTTKNNGKQDNVENPPRGQLMHRWKEVIQNVLRGKGMRPSLKQKTSKKQRLLYSICALIEAVNKQVR